MAISDHSRGRPGSPLLSNPSVRRETVGIIGAIMLMPPKAPMDRRAPVISREEIEAVERNEGHRHLHRHDADEVSVGKDHARPEKAGSTKR